MDKFEKYFLGITDEDVKQHKAQVRKVRVATNSLLRNESKRLIKRGYYDN